MRKKIELLEDDGIKLKIQISSHVKYIYDSRAAAVATEIRVEMEGWNEMELTIISYSELARMMIRSFYVPPKYHWASLFIFAFFSLQFSISILWIKQQAMLLTIVEIVEHPRRIFL